MQNNALTVALMALAASPLSGTTVQTTCSLRVARSGLESTPQAINDAGVLEVKQILDSVLAHAAPNPVVLVDMESALQGRYGTGNVVTQTAVPAYSWEYDPVSDSWRFMCSQEGLLFVDDGGASPVVVRAEFRVPYVDPK